MKKCKTCKKEIPKRNIFCNNICQGEFYYSKYIKRWKNGLENGKQGSEGTSDYIKKYLFRKYDNKCSKCGWNELNVYTKKIPLQLEHKDGHWDNNKESNLALLCPNCHSLTKTWGGANRGNGRKFRYS